MIESANSSSSHVAPSAPFMRITSRTRPRICDLVGGLIAFAASSLVSLPRANRGPSLRRVECMPPSIGVARALENARALEPGKRDAYADKQDHECHEVKLRFGPRHCRASRYFAARSSASTQSASVRPGLSFQSTMFLTFMTCSSPLLTSSHSQRVTAGDVTREASTEGHRQCAKDTD